MRVFLLSLSAVLLTVQAADLPQPGTDADPGFQKKAAVVTFNNGVQGKISLTQDDYKSPLKMDVDLKGLKEGVGPWHVHRLPVTVVNDCGANSTSGHYNPMNVTANYKECGDLENCEAGDLSTKYGALVAGDVKKDIADPKLSLFGFNSIVGRSIVLHNQDGTRFACGTIKYDDETPLTSAKAVFTTGPLTGSALFSQPTKSNIADTAVLMDLKLAEGTAPPAGPVTYAIYDAACGTDGAKVLNPGELGACKQFVNTSPFHPCSLGDLSGRHGALKLPASGGGAVFFNDYLPLTGEGNIVGKSLVFDTTPPSCANIVASASAAPLARKLRSNKD